MAVYVYDGTWDGLMCLVYRTAEDAEIPDEIVRTSVAERFLFEERFIENNADLAQATATVLRQRLSFRLFSDVWFALLSENEGIDLAVWHCLAAAWSEQGKAEMDLASPFRHAVYRSAQATAKEYARFQGLVRFQKSGGVYYARIEPECDILVLLAQHFSERLSDQKWVLHDIGRGKAALYGNNLWTLTEMKVLNELHVKEEEEDYQTLWREFYKSTTTLERLSYKRQRTFLPKKYWKHLVEVPGELNGSTLQ